MKKKKYFPNCTVKNSNENKKNKRGWIDAKGRNPSYESRSIAEEKTQIEKRKTKQ